MVEANHDILYDIDQCYYVNAVYIISLIIWFIVVAYYRLYRSSGAVFLWLPVIVFGISYSNVELIDSEVEECMSKANYLSIGLILSLHLLIWISKDLKSNRDRFVTVVMIAMLFTTLTFIDVWVPSRYLPVFKHAQSSLQTMAISLLIYAFATYLLDGGKAYNI